MISVLDSRVDPRSVEVSPSPNKARLMVKDLKERIGAAVRAARSDAGLTQEELADLINRHADSVSLIERGRTLPTLDMLIELAAALKLSINTLVPNSSGEKTNEKPKSMRRLRLEAEIVQLLKTVPDKRLETVRDQVRMIADLD